MKFYCNLFFLPVTNLSVLGYLCYSWSFLQFPVMSKSNNRQISYMILPLDDVKVNVFLILSFLIWYLDVGFFLFLLLELPRNFLICALVYFIILVHSYLISSYSTCAILCSLILQLSKYMMNLPLILVSLTFSNIHSSLIPCSHFFFCV